MAKKNGNSVVNLGAGGARDFYLKITGSTIGSKTGAGGTGPGGLLDAAKGSAKIRKMFDNKKGK